MDEKVREQVHEAIAAHDAAHPYWRQEKREREIKEAKEAEERARRAQEARRQVEQQHLQQQVANNSKAWCDWVDQRIGEYHRLNSENLIESLGQVVAKQRDDRDKEISAAVKEAQRAVEVKITAKLEALEQHILKQIKQCFGRTDAVSEAIGKECVKTNAAVEEAKRAFEDRLETKLTALEDRLKAVPGKLPVAKTWRPETVVYQAEFVTHDGALWQAKKDTAQAPGGTDWVCVARAGRDAITPEVRGTYTTNRSYRALNIVAMDGGSFIAKHDNPGVCPGDDWQLLCKQGKSGRRGDTGERGPAGPQGDQGPPAKMPLLASTKIDEHYNLVVLRSDDSLEIIPLREAFERYHTEVNR